MYYMKLHHGKEKIRRKSKTNFKETWQCTEFGETFGKVPIPQPIKVQKNGFLSKYFISL